MERKIFSLCFLMVIGIIVLTGVIFETPIVDIVLSYIFPDENIISTYVINKL